MRCWNTFHDTTGRPHDAPQTSRKTGLKSIFDQDQVSKITLLGFDKELQNGGRGGENEVRRQVTSGLSSVPNCCSLFI